MPEQGALQRKLSDINRAAEERDALRRAEHAKLEYADLRKVPVSIEAVKMVSEADAKKGVLIPVEKNASHVALVVYDPKSPDAQAVVKALEAKNYAVKLFVASRTGIEEAWHYYTLLPPPAKDITGKVEFEKTEIEAASEKFVSLSAVSADFAALDWKTTNTSRLLTLLLGGALGTRASDIHLEAEDKSARIRYRIDGVLHDVISGVPLKNYEALISRMKLASGMKINVHGEAQDGRFTIVLGAKEIEIRVSVIPSEFGETIVMRILDPDAISVDLASLGLRPDDLALVEEELKKPNGLLLNTGPTGSGKTTTLYAFLKHLTNPEIKIITIEDPIEYRVKGIEQTQVNNESGYTFARGLRAIVRQDPDVVLVGEIRDEETADIAVEASLTGHLVFSTLHTNDAVGTIPRLVNLGVARESVGSSLSLVIAQRLVRVLCESCRKPREMTPALKANVTAFLKRLPERVSKEAYANPTLFEPVGCEQCNSLGYKGRRGVFEFLRGGSALEETVLKSVSETALRAFAKAQGMVSMQEDGILKVLQGVTTFEEVESVTGPIAW